MAESKCKGAAAKGKTVSKKKPSDKFPKKQVPKQHASKPAGFRKNNPGKRPFGPKSVDTGPMDGGNSSYGD